MQQVRQGDDRTSFGTADHRHDPCRRGSCPLPTSRPTSWTHGGHFPLSWMPRVQANALLYRSKTISCVLPQRHGQVTCDSGSTKICGLDRVRDTVDQPDRMAQVVLTGLRTVPHGRQPKRPAPLATYWRHTGAPPRNCHHPHDCAVLRQQESASLVPD